MLLFLVATGVPMAAFVVAAVLATRSGRPLLWVPIAIVTGITAEQAFWFALLACDEKYPCQPLDEAPTLFVVAWLTCAAFIVGGLILALVGSGWERRRERGPR